MQVRSGRGLFIPAARLIMILAVVAAAGCATTPERYEARMAEARAIAGRYLGAVRGAAPDRGWSLLHPESRQLYGNYGQYAELATTADWSRFTWSFGVEGGGGYCDDMVLCHLALDIPGGEASVPRFLLRLAHASGDAVTLVPTGNAFGSGNFEIVVVFDRFIGPSGVWLAHG